ncbi:GDSL esterase/lipase WDL1 [Hevea brasiliensis]|nr:GDSL esterase/lipase WDL1 [Hevea brasiliensis]
MVGPVRPQFVLFGSSIVQFSYGNQGWGAALANIYARKADIVLRGYGGWNSSNALQILHQVFPKDASVQPSLVIVYFGGNDSMLPPSGAPSAHVPLDEFKDNMRRIARHLKSLSEKTRVIFLGVPPVNEDMIREFFGNDTGRTNEGCRIYSEACLEVCQEEEIRIPGIDLWNAIQRKENWLKTCFVDGIHLSAEGSEVVVEEILNVLREADWEPSVYWKTMPSEFLGITPFDSENHVQIM